MGKRGGRKGGRGRGGSGRGGGGQPFRRGERANKTDVDRHNEKYERYYDELGIVGEDERSKFWDAFRKDLPNSFRFTGSKAHALAVQQRLKDFYIPEITSIRYEGDVVEAPKPVTWYPDQLAWYMTTPKNVIRRFPPFASFQKFLVAETEVGNISRQEVVSMIPPLLMDIKPGMTVLDLCAAPGSKSAQLIEMVHAGEEDRAMKVAADTASGLDMLEGEEYIDDGRSTGLLIANDVDYRRAHMLVHQMKRLSSPNIIVTNHDATIFPSIKIPSKPSVDGKAVPNRYLKFDRILADVPCSGDGTSRKNLEIWRNWTPSNGLGLYMTQVRILVRALQMLKVGGRVVYSTCSMNPVEDEAVVATAIERCGGTSQVQILDASGYLPGLKRYPGLRSWKVMDKSGRIWNSYDEVKEQRTKTGDEGLSKLNESMFPPRNEMALENAMRVYPHQQDTGAFFIAILEKRSEIRAKPEETTRTQPMVPMDDHMKHPAFSDPEERGESDAISSHPASGVKVEGVENSHPSISKRKREEGDDLDDTSEIKRVRSETAPESGSSKQQLHGLPQNSAEERDATDKNGASVATTNQNGQVHEVEESPKLEGQHNGTTETGPSPSAEVAGHPSTAQNSNTLYKAKKKNGQPFEEPFKYLDPENDDLGRMRNFYNISPRFPQDRFMVRNAMGTASKNIYYTAALAKSVLQENEGKGMKFVHAGVKMFVKQDVPSPDVCPWRIQTDGLPILEAWVGSERIVKLHKRETLRKLLIEMFPRFHGDDWKNLGEIGEQVRDIGMGCCVLQVEPSEAEDGLSERMVFPLWKSLHSLNLMLPKEERKAMLLRLFNDDTPLLNLSLKQKSEQEVKEVDLKIETPENLKVQRNSSSPEPTAVDEDGDQEDDLDTEEGGVVLTHA